MFDLIDEDLIENIISERFEVLDDQYVADVCRDLLPEIRDTIDDAFETRFLIVESETGKPMNVTAVLKTREAAEEFLKIVGDDKHTIALLLTEK